MKRRTGDGAGELRLLEEVGCRKRRRRWAGEPGRLFAFFAFTVKLFHTAPSSWYMVGTVCASEDEMEADVSDRLCGKMGNINAHSATPLS